MTKVENFNGTITKQVINSRKLNFGRKIRTLTIADLHGYTDDDVLTNRLAETLKREDANVIFIAGDIYSGFIGNPWDGGPRLEKFRKFVQNISEAAPVCITWGNHDLRGMKASNKDARLKNFRNFENIRTGSVFPLYNDKVFVNGMEIVGYVPRLELMADEGLKTQIHGLAHDEFIRDYDRDGIKFDNTPGVVNVYLGHDPHLIAASENGVGLGDLSVCDFFVTGHLHDGYKPLIDIIDSKKKKITGKGFKSIDPIKSLEFDRGWTDQPGSIVDKDGKKIKREKYPLYLGKINLCRGIVYIDNDAQQKYLQLQDGRFFKNISNEVNVQDWQDIMEEQARQEILDNNLHFMLISEGITPLFSPKEELATVNIIDISNENVKKSHHR